MVEREVRGGGGWPGRSSVRQGAYAAQPDTLDFCCAKRRRAGLALRRPSEAGARGRCPRQLVSAGESCRKQDGQPGAARSSYWRSAVVSWLCYRLRASSSSNGPSRIQGKAGRPVGRLASVCHLGGEATERAEERCGALRACGYLRCRQCAARLRRPISAGPVRQAGTRTRSCRRVTLSGRCAKGACS